MCGYVGVWVWVWVCVGVYVPLPGSCNNNNNNIVSYFNWVAISLRLLLRPPVSLILTHTHNQIKSNSNCLVAAVGHLLSCPRLVAGGCREKNSKWHTGGVVPSVQCLTDFSANLLSHQHLSFAQRDLATCPP